MSRVGQCIKKEQLNPVDFYCLQQLNTACANFLAENFGYINALRNRRANISANEAAPTQDLIDYFVIEKSGQVAIYTKLNSSNDFRDIIGNIINEVHNAINDIDDIIINNKTSVDQNVLTAFETINRALNLFINTLSAQSRKLSLAEINSVEEIQQQVGKLLATVFNKYFIERLIPAVYNGMKIGSIDAYNLVLKRLNSFLADIGVHTISVGKDQVINYSICQPQIADDNYTDNYQLKDCIKEVVQLPYAFVDGNLVSEAKIIPWRFR